MTYRERVLSECLHENIYSILLFSRKVIRLSVGTTLDILSVYMFVLLLYIIFIFNWHKIFKH